MITANSVSSEEIVINAPAQIVWDVIVDFANYGLWNTFCPSMKGEAVVGSPVEMQVDLGNGPQTQIEYVTKVEPIHTIVWSMENKPGDPIHADRAQYIKPIDERSCSYVSIDEFSGEFAGPMIEQLGKQVEKGFNACAAGLKARAEELFSLASNKQRQEMTMFAFLTRLKAKPGKRDALIALNLTMQKATATEDGVPVYVFHTAADNPDEFYYYDLYESEAAYHAHCSTDAFRNMLSSLGELAEVTEMTKLIPFGPIKSRPIIDPA